MNELPDNPFLCPSFAATKESKLLGVLNKEGLFDILPKPLELSDDFVGKCREDGFKPEERFRFVGLCAKAGCSNWIADKCSIASNISQIADELYVEEGLPTCSIRPDCRWFRQEKGRACRICKFIATETFFSP